MQTPDFVNRPSREEHPRVQSGSPNSQGYPIELNDSNWAGFNLEEHLDPVAHRASDSRELIDPAPPSGEGRHAPLPKIISLYGEALELLQRRSAAGQTPRESLPTLPSEPFEICDTLIDGLRRTATPSGNLGEDTAVRPSSQLTEDGRLFQSALLFAYRVIEKLQHSGGEQGAPAEKLRHCAEVAMTLAAAGLSRDVVIAGILHDVLEAAAPASPSYSLSKPRAELQASLRGAITYRFGANVETLVSAATEPPRTPDTFDFIYRKSAVWQRLQPNEQCADFIGELAAIVCASKTNTFAKGLEFLAENKTTRGWSSGSLEENLFVCDALRARFVEARVPAPLLDRFDSIVRSWRQYLEQSSAPAYTPAGIPAACSFNAEALLLAKQITVITGGQTGVDRAALDAALQLGYPVEGFCPAGRTAEDGIIDVRYPLRASPSPDNAWRTIANARDADVTVIVSRGMPRDGTPLTSFACDFYRRPYLELSLDTPVDRAAFVAFVEKHQAKRINLAGPRESLDPGNVYIPALRMFLDLLTPRS